MKNQSGKTPLGWIVTIVIGLLVAGVIVAMLFVGNEEFSNKLKEYQNKNSTSQTQSE